MSTLFGFKNLKTLKAFNENSKMLIYRYNKITVLKIWRQKRF